jgi:Protein of unknown function (DUF4054)
MAVINFITIRAPEMVPLSDINDLILVADMQTGAFGDAMIGTMGTQREYAIALRVMHIVARRSRDGISANQQSTVEGQSGIISSEREGELSRSYKVSDKVLDRYPDLATTIWGMELIDLIRGTFFMPRTATMDFTINQGV